MKENNLSALEQSRLFDESGEPLTLQQAIKKGWRPKAKKLTKKYLSSIKEVAENLQVVQTHTELRKTLGQDLIDQGQTSIAGEKIDPKESYTVKVPVKAEVNHFKKLKKAWKEYNCPYGILVYCFSQFKEEFHNDWTIIMNEMFETDYPLPFKREEDDPTSIQEVKENLDKLADTSVENVESIIENYKKSVEDEVETVNFEEVNDSKEG